MEQYGKILIIAMPLFLVLILIEMAYGYFKFNQKTALMDSVSSISSGMTNSVKDVLGLSITFISYNWMLSKVAIFHLEANALTFIIAFIAIDFYGYWIHRLAHQINFFLEQTRHSPQQ